MSGTAQAAAPPLRGPLRRYRVIAYVTGSWLLVLVFVGIPLQLAGHPGVEQVTGFVHGYLFLGYLVIAGLDLCLRARFPLGRILLVLAAGTIPFLSFVMERRVRRELTAAGRA